MGLLYTRDVRYGSISIKELRWAKFDIEYRFGVKNDCQLSVLCHLLLISNSKLTRTWYLSTCSYQDS